jgi:hypothetical protein
MTTAKWTINTGEQLDCTIMLQDLMKRVVRRGGVETLFVTIITIMKQMN